MKILFISKYRVSEPLGVMYLSSYLKKYGHNCDFLDLKFEGDVVKEVKKIYELSNKKIIFKLLLIKFKIMKNICIL